MSKFEYPRIVIAGLSGDSGKTFVSIGLLANLRELGFNIAVFKKGPDYIDPAWLSFASNEVTRNLDTFLMDKEDIIESFTKNSYEKDISIIEGNRGLFDGFDIKGTHSTAELAKLLKAPVILVITVKKVTRTVAALVLGCKLMDKDLNISGVIINQYAGERHKQIIKNAIESETGISVVGAIPRLKDSDLMPSRHLGLVTPAEFDKTFKSIDMAKETIANYVDISKIIEISRQSDKLEYLKPKPIIKRKDNVKIGFFGDKIFSFYYPENLEALANEGAELIKISSFEDRELPEVDGLYIGGGFPETNIRQLLDNKSMMDSVKKRANQGMPIYAECGGLIYLSNSIEIEKRKYQLSNVFPINLKMDKKPQGHGYYKVKVDEENPFFEIDEVIRGHEFHYSKVMSGFEDVKTCFSVERGSGSFKQRDGLIYKNVFASYLHLHTLGYKKWAVNFVNLIKKTK